MKKRIQHIYLNKSAVFASFAMLFCYLCVSIELWISSLSESVVAYRPSAFIYALEPILFGGVIYLFPFCACLPITDRNVDEQLSKKSALNRILYAFVSGGLAVSLPFLFHTILWNVLAIPVNPKQYESHSLQMFGLLNDLYDKLYGIPVYGIFFAGMFYSAGTYAVMHLLLRSAMKDRIVAFTVPSVLYFLWLKLSVTFAATFFPSPVDLFDEGITVQNIPVSIAIYTVILVTSSVAYYTYDQKKGNKHES